MDLLLKAGQVELDGGSHLGDIHSYFTARYNFPESIQPLANVLTGQIVLLSRSLEIILPPSLLSHFPRWTVSSLWEHPQPSSSQQRHIRPLRHTIYSTTPPPKASISPCCAIKTAVLPANKSETKSTERHQTIGNTSTPFSPPLKFSEIPTRRDLASIFPSQRLFLMPRAEHGGFVSMNLVSLTRLRKERHGPTTMMSGQSLNLKLFR